MKTREEIISIAIEFINGPSKESLEGFYEANSEGFFKEILNQEKWESGLVHGQIDNNDDMQSPFYLATFDVSDGSQVQAQIKFKESKEPHIITYYVPP